MKGVFCFKINFNNVNIQNVNIIECYIYFFFPPGAAAAAAAADASNTLPLR